MRAYKEGILKDLSEKLYKDIEDINSIISDRVKELYKTSKYKSIDKKIIDSFIRLPLERTGVPSLVIYKNKSKYSLMIQVTGHIDSKDNNDEMKLFHNLVKEVFNSVRHKIRKRFKATLSSEYSKSKPFEGFDVWYYDKVAKDIWDMFPNKQIKGDKEMHESVLTIEGTNLPIVLQNQIVDSFNSIKESYDKFINKYEELKYSKINKDCIGDTVLVKNGNIYEGFVYLTGIKDDDLLTESCIKEYNSRNKALKNIYEYLNKSFDNLNPCKKLVFIEADESYIGIKLNEQYSKMLYEKYSEKEVSISNNDVIVESYDNAKSKHLLHSLSQDIINSVKTNKFPDINQYTLNIYANIINENLLKNWTKNFTKIKLILERDKDNVIEFITPKVSKDFVNRFINGRETLDGLIHRDNEIKVKLSSNIFINMTNADKALPFFKRLVKYYDKDLSRHGSHLATSLMKLSPEMKELISNTNLSNIINTSIKLFTTLNTNSIENLDVFNISKSTIDKVSNYITSIYKNYDKPEKERKEILSDYSDFINTLVESSGDNSFFKYFNEIKNLYNGNYTKDLISYKERWEYNQIDLKWANEEIFGQKKYLVEKTKIKKLKKIPSDLVAYISISTEAIKDVNDKMMIASYCIGKIEIVEWYIELLTVGSKKYIVPHSKEYLENIRTQLLACYKKILDTKIPDPTSRPLLDIKYPSNYEG